MPSREFAWFLVFDLVVVLLSVATKKLTIVAAFIGGCIAAALYAGVGYAAVVQLGIFFLLGTLATSWKFKQKLQTGLTLRDDKCRDVFQVFANGGLAGLLAVTGFWLSVDARLIAVMIAACFSSATADTLSSELGSLYGRRFFNIISFRPDKRGENGVVSLEGLIFGLIGSIIIGVIHLISYGPRLHECIIIIVAGTAGNISDSILGATLERKQLLGNNAVNFLNTLVAALVALVLLRI